MNTPPLKSYTAFDGDSCIGSGGLQEVALIVKSRIESDRAGSVLIYDDATGRAIDINTQGTDEEVVARLPPQTPPASHTTLAQVEEPRGRGRPRLGVVAREVTLLPRHWDWLSEQSGGASVALRKLVEDARRIGGAKDRERQAKAAAFHFMSAMAGNFPGFEEATRALFANDRQRFAELVAPWPQDIRVYANKLAELAESDQ